MTFEPEKKEMKVVHRKAIMDPEFIEGHPVKQDYMHVTIRKAKIASKNERNGIVEERDALVQPLGEIKKVGEQLVLDTEVPDTELPEGEYYIKNKKGRIFKLAVYDTIFKTDLKTLVKGQLFECPAQIFPTIAERMCQTARNEIKAKYPETRKVDKFPFWILMIPIMVVCLLIGLSMIQ